MIGSFTAFLFSLSPRLERAERDEASAVFVPSRLQGAERVGLSFGRLLRSLGSTVGEGGSPSPAREAKHVGASPGTAGARPPRNPRWRSVSPWSAIERPA